LIPHGRVTWQSTPEGENSLSRLGARQSRGRYQRARSGPTGFGESER
jgi:hypothetical protein